MDHMRYVQYGVNSKIGIISTFAGLPANRKLNHGPIFKPFDFTGAAQFCVRKAPAQAERVPVPFHWRSPLCM
jgi:hypothetical protein